MTKVDTHKTDCFGRIHWATAPKAYNAIIYPVIESFQTSIDTNVCGVFDYVTKQPINYIILFEDAKNYLNMP